MVQNTNKNILLIALFQQTLGVSIISFIELGYFFTFGTWFQFRSEEEQIISI